MSKHPIVFVQWVDSSTTHGWQKYERTDLRCESAGFLLAETEDRIVITDSFGLDDESPKDITGQNVHCPQEIPKVAITRMIHLETPE